MPRYELSMQGFGFCLVLKILSLLGLPLFTGLLFLELLQLRRFFFADTASEQTKTKNNPRTVKPTSPNPKTINSKAETTCRKTSRLALGRRRAVGSSLQATQALNPEPKNAAKTLYPKHPAPNHKLTKAQYHKHQTLNLTCQSCRFQA